MNDFPIFFQTATGNSPYDWQNRLAENQICSSKLIDIPTGLGKTAGLVLAWLWNRIHQSAISNLQSAIPHWPRREWSCHPRSLQTKPFYKQTGKVHYQNHALSKMRQAKKLKIGKTHP